MWMKMFFFTACFLLAFFKTGILAVDATPPCFRELESSFFDRKPVIEALSYAEIQQGLWELIAIDLKSKIPSIHPEVRKLGRQQKRDPTDYPFRMEASKRLLETVLFRMIDDTMRRYKYVLFSESDISRVFAFIKAAHQKRWNLCK